jgi:PadR family transcriptional regulator, regulatory protein PadR
MQPQKQFCRDRIDLLQGTLDLLILTTLQWGPQHGYGVSLAIKANSSGVLRVETGSLYPALHRLEKQGWVASEWKHTETNQPAKSYRLTAAGKRQVAAEQSRWQQLVTAMAAAMNAGLKESES